MAKCRAAAAPRLKPKRSSSSLAGVEPGFSSSKLSRALCEKRQAFVDLGQHPRRAATEGLAGKAGVRLAGGRTDTRDIDAENAGISCFLGYRFVAVQLIQPPDIAHIVGIAAVRVEMMRFAALDHGQGLLLAEAERGCAALGADGAVGGIVAGAVEEHADAQGDGLAAAQLFLLVFLFQPVRRGIAGLLLPGAGIGRRWSLRQFRRGGRPCHRRAVEVQRLGRHEGRRGVRGADDDGARAADDQIAMVAEAALDDGGSAIDQHVGDDIARQDAAACGGIAGTGGGQAVEEDVGRAADDGVVAMPLLRAGSGVAEAGGGFAGHDQSPYRYASRHLAARAMANANAARFFMDWFAGCKLVAPELAQ